MDKAQFTWKGEAGRPFRLCRPCECGCDLRDGNKGVGYLNGSDNKGNGVTIWIKSEAVYQIIKKCGLPELIG